VDDAVPPPDTLPTPAPATAAAAAAGAAADVAAANAARYVCVLDDDVLLHPLGLMQLVDELEDDQGLFMATGACCIAIGHSACTCAVGRGEGGQGLGLMQLVDELEDDPGLFMATGVCCCMFMVHCICLVVSCGNEKCVYGRGVGAWPGPVGGPTPERSGAVHGHRWVSVHCCWWPWHSVIVALFKVGSGAGPDAAGG
jgi:hypothetical protein